MATASQIPPRYVWRVLALDGGGLRGILPATVLTAIEEKTGRPISELFDFIVGTSTGGIIALGLTAPGRGGGPAYSAAHLRELYLQHAQTIFPLGGEPLVQNSGLLGQRSPLPPNATFAERVQHFMGYENTRKVMAPLGGSKYSADGLEAILKQYFGDVRLSQALSFLAVTSYDYASRRTVLFRSYLAGETGDPLMREVARATSAGPTFFPPAAVSTVSGGVFVDGGLTANNPAMVAYLEAIQQIYAFSLQAGVQSLPLDVFLVSIGTGEVPDAPDDVTVQLVERENWAELFKDRLMSALFTGTVELHDEQLQRLLNLEPERGMRYWRIQTSLQDANFAMDDSRSENVAALSRDADRMVAEHTDALTDLSRQLLAFREIQQP